MGKIETEKQTVAYMIGLYCKKKHKTTSLCNTCEELKVYALERLTRCQYGDSKAACKNCTTHCYKVIMRQRIRDVMKFSGPRMIFYYPIDYVQHLFNKIPL